MMDNLPRSFKLVLRGLAGITVSIVLVAVALLNRMGKMPATLKADEAAVNGAAGGTGSSGANGGFGGGGGGDFGGGGGGGATGGNAGSVFLVVQPEPPTTAELIL